MPTRRKNVDLGRIKRPSKKSRISDYFSSAYVQYLMIFLIWGALLLINQSTEMRFEYFWPGWLFICSIHDSLKYQGLQYTIVFIIIVITMDLICFFLVPASWIYSCGSAYVWVYLLWHTDQGLCFLTLTFCFIFVYFELGFYSRETKLNHSIYLFRPFAAHSIGYPVVCMGFSIKRYLDVRHRKYKKLEVRRQNCVYFRLLREAVPSHMLAECPAGVYSAAYLADDIPDSHDAKGDGTPPDVCRGNIPWSLFLVIQLFKSLCSKLARWTPLHVWLGDRECHSIHFTPSYSKQNGTNNNSHSLSNGALSGTSGAPSSNAVTNASAEASGRRGGHCEIHTGPSSNRRPIGSDSVAPDGHGKSGGASGGGNSKACGPGKSRPAKEDLATRLENSIRRLRTEVQSMRAVEAQLRGQLTQLERDDRLNRLSLSNQRQENETLAANITKLSGQTRTERANVASMEQTLNDERRARQQLEEQLVEIVSHKESESDANPRSEDTPRSTGHGKAVQVSSDLLSPPDSEPERVIEAACCSRRHRLESEVYTLRVASRRQDEQLRTLSGARARQANHSHQQLQQQQLNRGSDSISYSSRHSAPHGEGKVKTALSFPSREVHASESSPPSGVSEEGVINAHREQLMLETYLQLASEERERLANTLREENWMKQELLTAYHTAVREITELNKTHKQRDLQILELTMKIEQLECLAASSGNRSTRTGKKDNTATSFSFMDRSQSTRLSESRLPSDYPNGTSQTSLFSYFTGDSETPCTTAASNGNNSLGYGLTPLERFTTKLGSSTLPTSTGTVLTTTNLPAAGASSTRAGNNTDGLMSSVYADQMRPIGPDSVGRGSNFTFAEVSCGDMAANSLSVSSITRLSTETR
ncbi:putative Transmembrane protein 57 [Fasciola gigantica]|uniref:Macoilin n=1 Tax=Fasciola gigantica TaxID=46835 RepID=A0A504Y9E7_FASGI|nr:putative Transmembrane protein 57 [Fasciola gigantica]